jgi:hypothetical protein
VAETLFGRFKSKFVSALTRTKSFFLGIFWPDPRALIFLFEVSISGPTEGLTVVFKVRKLLLPFLLPDRSIVYPFDSFLEPVRLGVFPGLGIPNIVIFLLALSFLGGLFLLPAPTPCTVFKLSPCCSAPPKFI